MNTPRTQTYQLLLYGFEGWMRSLGYAPGTVYGSVRFTGEFLCFLEIRQLKSLDALGQHHVESYEHYLRQRPVKKGTGALSVSSITSHLNALRRFSRYLHQTGKYTLDVGFPLPGKQLRMERMVLSLEEIRRLYQVSDNTFLGVRDRAMLGIYYGCGLRRSEGVALELRDVDLHGSSLFVRRGKGCSERYIPLSEAIKRDFNAWLAVRGQLAVNPEEKAFLTSVRGKALKGPAVMERLKGLVKLSGVDRTTGLHTLRHSIATHLLKSGMSLEMVSRFLGHRSLESTQIYTHLVNEKF